jgi:hypothetical protein
MLTRAAYDTRYSVASVEGLSAAQVAKVNDTVFNVLRSCLWASEDELVQYAADIARAEVLLARIDNVFAD